MDDAFSWLGPSVNLRGYLQWCLQQLKIPKLSFRSWTINKWEMFHCHPASHVATQRVAFFSFRWVQSLQRWSGNVSSARKSASFFQGFHGSLNVPIEHHPTIRYMVKVYNGYYKVMSNIPKMGQLPTPGFTSFHRTMLKTIRRWNQEVFFYATAFSGWPLSHGNMGGSEKNGGVPPNHPEFFIRFFMVFPV